MGDSSNYLALEDGTIAMETVLGIQALDVVPNFAAFLGLAQLE